MLSVFQVLVAILPQTQMQYFDVQSKSWKPLPSMALLTDATACFCAELVGNYLYVAAANADECVVYRYHVVSNTWDTLPPFFGSTDKIDCLCFVEDHIYAIRQSLAPHRYNVSTNRWQCVSKSSTESNMGPKSFCNKSAVVFKSCIYVLHGQGVNNEGARGHFNARSCDWQPTVAVLHCFDRERNVWEQKASTSNSHFGSSLFVANNRLCVAGGKCSINPYSVPPDPEGSTALVEVYDEQNNTWSVVQQTHIPPNNLGAVEVEGRVYFIINSFPVDSGIRIPPGEVYPVCLDEWENLGKIETNAILCYVPIKMDNLTMECT